MEIKIFSTQNRPSSQKDAGFWALREYPDDFQILDEDFQKKDFLRTFVESTESDFADIQISDRETQVPPCGRTVDRVSAISGP